MSTRAEIENIFGQKKKQKENSKPEEAEGEKKSTKAGSNSAPTNGVIKKTKKKKPRIRGSADNILGDDEWKDDGLGGVYDKNGWTGRTTEDGLRIYKKHLLKIQEGGGESELCPFDCECCC